MAEKELKKAVLRKLPVQLATAHVVSQAKRHEAKFYIKAAVQLIDHKRMLVLNIYHKEDLLSGKMNPRIRTFLTKTDYISQEYENGSFKWRTGRLETLVDWQYYNSKKPVFCDTGSEKSVDRYFSYLDQERIQRAALEKIKEVQRRIMTARLEKKHQKLKQSIDEKMCEIKPLPKNFLHWIDETAMAHSRYIYYRYSSKKYIDGYCTHCHQEVKVQKPKHRSKGICPNCGVKIMFLAEGRAKYISDRGQAAYFQKTKNGFVIRYFSINKIYKETYRQPKISLFELKRDFYEGNKISIYEYRQFKQTGKIRWCDGWLKFSFPYAAVYTKNLDYILQDTKYRYCALKQFAQRQEGAPVHPYGYLRKYQNMPFLEYFVKAGLYKMAYAMTSSDWCRPSLNMEGKTLPEILGINKQEFRFVQKCDMSFNELSAYKKLRETGINLSAEEFERFYHFYHEDKSHQEIYTALRYTTLHKAERYCKESVDHSHGYFNTLGIWKDYILFCEELEYELRNEFLLFPRNLFQAHDQASKEVQEKREQKKRAQMLEEDRKARILLQKYEKIYPWTDGTFSIIVPKDLLDIKEEGHTLHHCAATYTSKVARGDSIILFVRQLHQPEKPFYTLEVKNGSIVQCKGYRNNNMTEDVEKFVLRYEKTVLRKTKVNGAA